MGIKHTSWKKSQRFILTQRIAWLMALSLSAVLILLALFPRHSDQIKIQAEAVESGAGVSKAKVLKQIAAPKFDRERRVVYPHSVISGGVRSVAELTNAIARDPIVSAHYAGFQLASARIVRLDRDRSLHVSYRLGNQVYWTKQTIKVPKGETVITDGVRLARTRCGNLLAEAISGPSLTGALGAHTSPNEPTGEELDTPQDTVEPTFSVEYNLPSDPSLAAAADFVHGQTGGGQLGEGGESYSESRTKIPLFLAPLEPSTTSTTGPGLAPSIEIPIAPVVSVPESGTFVLLVIGLSVLLLLRKFWV